MNYLLTTVLFLPLIGAIAVALLPREEVEQCRHVGFLFGLLTFLFSLVLLGRFDLNEEGMQFQLIVPWITALGVNFHIGLDGISLWLVLLTTFITPVALLGAYRAIQNKVKEFVVAMLVLELGMLGAFVALDLFLFYVFWEVMLLPMYLIIGIWGHGNRVYAAIKFVIYTMIGSLLMLIAIIYIYVTHGAATGDYTFNYLVLTQSIWGQQAQLWLFFAFALAFAIKVPVFPLHTWLPDAHTQAPTAGSVILASVLLKLGTYGFLRFALPLFPWAAAVFAPYLTALAVVSIVYGALVAYVQHDAKRLIAYSSVSHLGFVMLGILSMNPIGISGGIYQMLAHGLSTGGLFYGIGLLYERRHTHELNQFGGLWQQMPKFAGIYMVIMLASAGLPGLCGFVGEFLVLVGSFIHDSRIVRDGLPQFIVLANSAGEELLNAKAITAIAATGVVLGVIYLLHLFQKLMFGPITRRQNAQLADLSLREVWTFLPLLVLIFLMGIYPKPFLIRMEPAIKLTLRDFKTKYVASRGYRGAQPRQLSSMGHRFRVPQTRTTTALLNQAVRPLRPARMLTAAASKARSKGGWQWPGLADSKRGGQGP